MSEELLPLRDEHLAQYESIINKIRESDKYKKLQKIRESEINEYNAAIWLARFHTSLLSLGVNIGSHSRMTVSQIAISSWVGRGGTGRRSMNAISCGV